MMLLISGCRNFELGAEPGSKWVSEDYIDDTTWLFQGKYNYNPNGKTITLYCEKDQIGLDVDQIVLYSTGDGFA